MASRRPDAEEHPNNHQMAKITVGLHSQDGELSRSFTLDRSNPSIEVGRASKSGETRLRAQPDNVWIESPIMSRDHATITMGDSKSNPLHIIDSGSTHGTFVEDQRLEPRKEHGLSNWDKVVFGVPVLNGSQTFHPKTFMVEYKFEEQNARGLPGLTNNASHAVDEQPNVFRVPSPSDSEDELDDEEIEQHYIRREPSVQLISAGRGSGRAVSEDVVFVSQSQIPSGNENKNSATIDLTDPDPSETAAVQGKRPAEARESEGPEILRTVNVKEPLRSSGTYRLDYDEQREDQDMQPEEEEEAHYEPDNNPASVPDNIELIEELLDAPRSEQDYSEDMEYAPPSPISSVDEPGSLVSPTYSPYSPPHSPASPVYSPRSPSSNDKAYQDGGRDGNANLTEKEKLSACLTSLSEGIKARKAKELLDRQEAERIKRAYGSFQPRADNDLESTSSISDDLNDDEMSTSESSSSEDLDYPSSEDYDGIDSLADASEFAEDKRIDDESDGEAEAPVTKSTQENLTTPVTAVDMDPTLGQVPPAVGSLPRPPSPSDAALAKSIPPPPWSMNAGRDVSFPPPPPPPNMQTMPSPPSPPLGGQGSFRSGSYSSRPGGSLWHDPFYEPPAQYTQASSFMEFPSYSPEPYPGDSQVFSLGIPMHHTPYFAPAWYPGQQPAMTANDPGNSKPSLSGHQYVTPRPEARPSKVQISDIVNNTPDIQRPNHLRSHSPQDDVPQHTAVTEREDLSTQRREGTAEVVESLRSKIRAPKRKAAEMEDSKTEMRSEWGHEQLPEGVAIMDSQSQNIPDAQPREVVASSGASSGEIIEDSLPGPVPATEVLVPTQTRKQATASMRAPITNFLRNFNITPARGEPLRKKQKVSQPMSKPVSKPSSKKGTAVKTFVSGCIAGAVTVVGAAAALIATMPPGVQEEALRSL